MNTMIYWKFESSLKVQTVWNTRNQIWYHIRKDAWISCDSTVMFKSTFYNAVSSKILLFLWRFRSWYRSCLCFQSNSAIRNRIIDAHKHKIPIITLVSKTFSLKHDSYMMSFSSVLLKIPPMKTKNFLFNFINGNTVTSI